MSADKKKGKKDQGSAGKHASPLVSEILDQALDDEPPERRIKHPLVLDVLLSAGLLVAAGGFTLCLLQLYVTHTAQECLIKHDYKSTIELLSAPPIPAHFSSTFGYDQKEIKSAGKAKVVKIEHSYRPETLKTSKIIQQTHK